MNYNQASKILQTVEYIPYPKTYNVKEDYRLVNRLYNDYGGNVGEMTVINLYVFQHIDLDNESLKKIMIKVAEVEIKHLYLIGDLIKQLGKKPYYINRRGRQWSAEHINYRTSNIAEVMKCNINIENTAINNYLQDKNYTDNKSIKDLLDRIILDEESHKKIFKGILNDYTIG